MPANHSITNVLSPNYHDYIYRKTKLKLHVVYEYEEASIEMRVNIMQNKYEVSVTRSTFYGSFQSQNVSFIHWLF